MQKYFKLSRLSHQKVTSTSGSPKQFLWHKNYEQTSLLGLRYLTTGNTTAFASYLYPTTINKSDLHTFIT